jgi:hypothetical protein
VSPAAEGTHRPYTLRYAGGHDEKNYTFVLGEEENSVGTWVTLTRYLAHSQTDRSVSVWPGRETPGTHRGVAMAEIVYHSPYSPTVIDLYTLAQVQNPEDRFARTVTIAFTELADGTGMGVLWTREFDRITDDSGDTIPIAIRAEDGVIAVLAAVYDSTGTQVHYGINLYHALNGTILLRKVLPSEHTWNMPVDMVYHGGTGALWVTGTVLDAASSKHFIRTLGLGTSGDFQQGWAPGDPNTDIVLPGDHCAPVRMIESYGRTQLVVTGRAWPVEGVNSDVLTFCYHKTLATSCPPGQPDEVKVRWLHRFDSGSDDVPADIATNHWVTQIPGDYIPEDKVWVVGTRTTQGLKQMQLLQYDSLLPGNPPSPCAYPPGTLDWNDRDARWPENPTEGLSAEGHRIDLLKYVWPNTPGIQPLIAGRVQRDELEDCWDFGLWKYTYQDPIPGPYKDPAWHVVDAGIGSGEGNIPVGLDFRIIGRDGLGGYIDTFWFTGATMTPEGWQWYTAQWLDGP